MNKNGVYQLNVSGMQENLNVRVRADELLSNMRSNVESSSAYANGTTTTPTIPHARYTSAESPSVELPNGDPPSNAWSSLERLSCAPGMMPMRSASQDLPHVGAI